MASSPSSSTMIAALASALLASSEAAAVSSALSSAAVAPEEDLPEQAASNSSAKSKGVRISPGSRCRRPSARHRSCRRPGRPCCRAPRPHCRSAIRRHRVRRRYRRQPALRSHWRRQQRRLPLRRPHSVPSGFSRIRRMQGEQPVVEWRATWSLWVPLAFGRYTATVKDGRCPFNSIRPILLHANRSKRAERCRGAGLTEKRKGPKRVDLI